MVEGRQPECAVAEHSGRRQTPALMEARARRCTGHGLRVSVVVCDCGCGRVMVRVGTGNKAVTRRIRCAFNLLPSHTRVYCVLKVYFESRERPEQQKHILHCRISSLSKGAFSFLLLFVSAAVVESA